MNYYGLAAIVFMHLASVGLAEVEARLEIPHLTAIEASDADVLNRPRRQSAIPPPTSLQISKIEKDRFRASWIPAPRSSGITGIRVHIEEIGGTYRRTTVVKPKVSHTKFIDLKSATRYLVEIQTEKRGALSQKISTEVTTGLDKSKSSHDDEIDGTVRDTIKEVIGAKKPSYIEDCRETKMTDLVILIDGSWSVGPDNFKKMKKFLKSLAEAFNIGFDGVLMGLAQYSDDPRTEFALNEHVTTEELLDAIDQVEYKGGNTATGRALDFLREEMFTPQFGSRKEVLKTAIVITDGESILDDVSEPALRLREGDVEVFSIGVGAALRSELEDIASDPDNEHLFSVQNFDDIESIKDKLLKDVCRTIPICTTPRNPENGHVQCNNEQLRPDSTCTFVCDYPLYKLDVEFEAEAGEAVRTCTDEGSWDRKEPICVPAVCPDLTPPKNGAYECNDQFKVGSYCTLRCEEGYKSPGEVRTRCRKDSVWTSTGAGCIRIQCPKVPDVRNAGIDCDDGNYYHSTCTFSCNEGFKIGGYRTIQCTGSERWSRSLPTCTRITCSELTSLKNGQSICSDGENYSSECSFSCTSGYELVGSNKATCDSQGHWSFSIASSMPVCERITCNDLPINPFVTKRCTDNSDYGSVCSFDCEEGYKLVGSTSSTCTGTRSPGTWTQVSPACERIACPALQAPEHSRISCNGDTYYRSNCILICDVGYELKGQSEVECTTSGRWSGTLSSCGRIACGEIEPVAHGSVKCSDFDNFNSQCEYRCHVGYKITSGSSIRVCGADRAYSGATPKCQIKTCDELGPPEHGAIKCSHSNNYGSVCRFSCDLGHELVNDVTDEFDRAERLCQDDEQWSGTKPTCRMITCGVLVPPINGGMFCTNQGSFASICQFSCNFGYEMTGSPERMCREDKQWTGMDTACLLVTCGPIVTPDNGRVICRGRESLDDEKITSLDGFGTTCDIECEEGYYLTGSKRRTCGNDRVWSGAKPACVRIRCAAIPEPLHASLHCTATNEYGSECAVTCDTGYYLSTGTLIRTCQRNAKWNGQEPICQIKTCENLVAKRHTTITCTNGKRYGSICTIKTELGYKLRGPEVIECTDDGAEDPPPADLITCSPLQSPDSGLMTCTKESNYDSVCSFVCLDGYDLVGSTSRTCMLNGDWTDEPTSCILATCPPFPLPANGEVTCDNGNSYLSSCLFACNEGYDLIGPVVRTCRANHAWTPGIEVICNRIKCDEHPSLKNGDVKCSRGNDFSSVCKFVCDDGYQNIGSTQRVCRGDHTWSGAEPGCVLIQCLELSAPRNGRKKCTDGSNYASECTSVCEVGHTFSGSRLRTCLSDHTWSGDDVTCTVVQCGELETPRHGNKRCEDDDNFDSKCRFTCEIGYDLVGSAARTCQADGVWSGQPASCSLVRCGTVNPPPQGVVTCTDKDRFESLCRYECAIGHDLVGTPVRQCQADHTWNGTQPICQVIRCGMTKAPLDGTVECTNMDKFNSLCSFACNPGYRLVQGDGRVCTEHRSWTGSDPLCEEITCSQFEIPKHTTVDCSRSTQFRSRCRVIPEPGYTYNGDPFIECGPGGLWTNNIGSIEGIFCEELSAPPNGRISCTDDNFFDSTCSFTCNTGYELRGSATRKCVATTGIGEWTGEAVTCNMIECPKLTTLRNGNVRCDHGSRFDSRCMFSCDDGYQLMGEEESVCQSRRTWSNNVPLCVQITCGAVLGPQFGTMTCSDGDRHNSVCTIQCNDGYKRSGSETRTCLPTHSWSGEEPKCSLIRCGPQEAPSHGSVSCSAADAYSSKCTFGCNMGYHLVGDDMMTCGVQGLWIGRFPTCEMIQCEELLAPTNGVQSCTSRNDYNSLCRAHCHTGYELIGSPSRVCQADGTFSGTPVSCELTTCDELEDIENGLITCNDVTNYNSECDYVCDEGFLLAGPSHRRCLSSGRWSDTKPHCERVTCRKLRTISRGSLSCTSGNEASSTCTVTCDSCYELLGSRQRTCRMDGTWSGEEAACMASQCDPIRAPLNGKKDCGEKLDECGNTCKFSCKEGFKLLGSESRTCQEDSLWTGQPAECIRNECAMLLSLDNDVAMKCTDGNRIGSNCTFTCTENATLVGSTHRVCTKHGVWSNTNPVCRACKTAVSDIMFIVDGSWSVGNENFRKAKDFLKALVHPFKVGWDNSRFAVVQYSDDPRTEFLLTDHLTTQEVMSAIDAIPYKGGNTNTGRAISFSLYKALSLTNGARPFVSKTALVLTDGRSQDEVGNPAREMRNAGIRVVTVGVGDADINELRQMASPPHESTVFHVSDYDSIKQIQTLLAAKLCESERPARTGMCDCPAGPPGPPGKIGLPGISGLPGAATKGAKGDPYSVIHVNYEKQVIQALNGDGSVVDLELPSDITPGIPGIKGSVGSTGTAGSSGLPGQLGLRGPPGPPGSEGPMGPPGRRGEKGDTVRSSSISATDKTEILLRAKQLAVQIAQEEIRKALSELDRERRLAVRSPVERSHVYRGEVGLQGPPGPPGPQGFEGPQGIQGLRGVPGAKGDTGEKGNIGDRGPKGPPGIGLIGPPGPVGPRGPRGKTGKPGKGKPGKRGQRGQRGPPGKFSTRIKAVPSIPQEINRH